MKPNILIIEAVEVKREGGFTSRFNITVRDHHATKTYGDFDDHQSLMEWAGSRLDFLKKVANEDDFNWDFYIEDNKVFLLEKCEDIAWVNYPKTD